jgi:hypothetical protein
MSFFQDPNTEYFTVLSPESNPNTIKKSLSLVDPSNVFLYNNDVLNNLNAYETKYSRYIRCQNNMFAKNVNPKCDPYGSDSYSSLEQSYSNLMNSINVVNNTILNQTTKDAVSPEVYISKEEDIVNVHKHIVELREKLDAKLQKLYSEYDINPESSQAQLNSAIYANTLWTILATCLIYYIFVEMK